MTTDATDAADAARTTMAALVPPQVAVAETERAAGLHTMFASEAPVVAGAVPKRQSEFATVRHCARQALARLDVAPVAILPGPDREPQWPHGIVGSLTHCEGYAAAAVARAATVHSIGIDAELNEPLPDGVGELVTVGGETAMLAALPHQQPAVAWDRLLFSAKEAIYKAWFPLAGTWLDFTECELTIDPGGNFRGRLLVPGPTLGATQLETLHGRWATRGDLLFTAVSL